MKSKRFVLLCVLLIAFLAVSCNPTASKPVASIPEFGTSDTSTGQVLLREGKGIRLSLEILPDTDTTGWIVRVNLYSADHQDDLRVSIFSRSTRYCGLEIKKESQTPLPSEYSPTTISWDVDVEKDQSQVFTVLLGNCSDTSEGMIAELFAGAMMRDTTIIQDSAAIFLIGDHTQVKYYGTPWPTPTYDPLMPEIPEDYDQEVTPFWDEGTPKVTPSDVATTLIFELTLTAYHTPTPVGTLPSPTPTPIPQTPVPYP
ncbi:MAG: hypothetical protein GXY80_14150 [Syntrophorhabdus aromaticivorans]|jgi:hypothetical protein|uniref:Glucodextranase-like C-terminal domain-containing protein n=1 Tax=Syntrophorhabdus aromaticivorans TaxID=328301 RepID=A0A971M6N2_9BACT|nr:hypothetical protein [Syntrophorhabdus aromaticivorans]